MWREDKFIALIHGHRAEISDCDFLNCVRQRDVGVGVRVNAAKHK